MWFDYCYSSNSISDNSTKSRIGLTPCIAPLKIYILPLFRLLPKFWKNSGKCSDKVWTNLDIVLTISSQAFLASAFRASSSRSQFMGNRLGMTKIVNLGGSKGLSPAKKTPHRYEFLEINYFVWKRWMFLCHDGTYAAVTFPSFNNSLNFVLNSSLVSCKSPSSWAKAASKLQMAKITKMSQYCEVFISELKDQLNPVNTQSSIMTHELA